MTGRPLRGRTRSLGRYTTRIHRTLPQDRPRGAGLQVRQTRGAPAGGCRRRPSAPRAPSPTRAGLESPRSVRLRGTRGRGMVTPMAPSRTSPRTRAATLRSGGEGGRSARGTPRGGVGTWKSGILGTCGAAGLRAAGCKLRGCGAAARGRFTVFQDFRFSPSQAPHLPAASPGARPVAMDRPRGEKLEPEWLRFARSGHRRAEFGPEEPFEAYVGNCQSTY